MRRNPPLAPIIVTVRTILIVAFSPADLVPNEMDTRPKEGQAVVPAGAEQLSHFISIAYLSSYVRTKSTSR